MIAIRVGDGNPPEDFPDALVEQRPQAESLSEVPCGNAHVAEIRTRINHMDETKMQRLFFHPVCSESEIDRIFNVQNAPDYLLKIRAETIIDHIRLFRVYRNKALAIEKGWSLERSFDNTHFLRYLRNIC
jgi:hypothetical protein